MSVSIRAVVVVVVVATLALTACKPSTPDAIIVSRHGTATVRKHGEGTPLDALLNSALFETDVVATGSDGTVALAFTGGNTLTLQPDTTVLIRRGGATGAELGAVVLAGSARASSPGATRRLVIGSPFGMTELGGSELVVDVDLVKGLSVLIGQVSVIKDGNATVVEAGSSLSVDGLIVPLAPSGAVEVAGLTTVLEPKRATLITTSKVVQVRAQAGEWVAAEPRQMLDPGAAVRTRKARGTQVRFDDGSSVALTPNSELRFEEAKGNDKQQKARYSLASGGADLHLTRHEGVDASHEVSVAGVGIDVRPGDREAEVDLKSLGSEAYEIGVRFGRVRLSDGTEIEAGSAVTVKDGKVASDTRPVAATGVELRAGTPSVVYYQGTVPPIAFDWRVDDAEATRGSYQITVASDKAMKDVVFSETVHKTGFVYDQFRAGRYFWRVKSGDTVREGSLLIQRGGENDCANCKRVNVIHDTGEKTVVFFQQALPALTFQWKAVAAASQYRLKVFADGAFERPLLEATSTGTSLPFQAGALQEGKYFWLVSAVDASGKPLAQSGRTNGLEIAYDNVINDLVIRSPKNGQRISGDRILTTGELVLGARLFVNGKQADLDDKGRFKLSVALARGERAVVYRTVAADGVQRYYVRELRR